MSELIQEEIKIHQRPNGKGYWFSDYYREYLARLSQEDVIEYLSGKGYQLDIIKLRDIYWGKSIQETIEEYCNKANTICLAYDAWFEPLLFIVKKDIKLLETEKEENKK